MSGLLALIAVVSGFHGVVMRGPTMPVCQIGKPCSEPAVGTVLIFSQSGHVVRRVRTVAGGAYSVRLRPGFYAVRLPTYPRMGSALEPRQVRVRAGIYGRLDFDIDTGIR
jgi:hypothetical protein